MRRSPRQEPLKYVTGPTFMLIGATVGNMLKTSWIERLLALFLVGPLLITVVLPFLPLLLLYDFAVLMDHGVGFDAPRGREAAEIKIGERESLVFRAGEGAGLRCAYCHDETSGLTHTCSECSTVVHTSCAAELGGCPTLGCSKAREPRKKIGA